MKKRQFLLLIFIILFLYPLYRAYLVLDLFTSAENLGELGSDITSFQLSIWLSWLGMVVISIFYKWTRKENFFFKLTYIFIVLAFSAFGYFTQHALDAFGNSSRFSDSYTLGVFTALQHLAVGVVFTIFLQIAVRIFQTKWHRR